MRKPKSVLWIVVYEGPGQTIPTSDFNAVWKTREAAERAIRLWKLGIPGYPVVKYVRAEVVAVKEKGQS